MHKLRVWTLIFFTFVIYSCNESGAQGSFTQNGEDAINIDITPGNVPRSFRLDSIIESVRYIQLESTGNALIGNINNVSFFEEYIASHDFQNKIIFLHREDGNAIGKIGRIGMGPGEYMDVTNVQFNPYRKTIDLLSNVPRKIIRYDLGTLKFKEEINLQEGPYLTKFYPYENYYLFSNDLFDPAFENFAYHFFLLNANSGKINDQFVPFKEFEKEKYRSAYILKKAFSIQNSSISAYYFNSLSIYEFEGSNLNQKYKFNFKKYPFVSDRLLDKRGRAELKSASKETCCLNPLFETKSFIYGSYYFRMGWGEQFVYSKKSKKIIQYSETSIINSFNGLYFRAQQGFVGDEIVFAVTPSTLADSYRNNKNSILSKEKQKLEEFLSKMDPQGNQVLIFYKLKDF